ncbi:hypothetical protein [Polaribacter sp. SA4-12]|uniref:hypothetical protein n=1 Tax=Polaribacter sp. SA4-12 TaxID=1312072 RepID=UPI000B3C2201|nr:hypothetical protein [Polaribacter sp. SA4-12]ARV15891.1 hypothetical protein BTO07_12395 [Polaribacter sp. SA4-12]
MKPYIYSILFLLSINFSFSQTKELVLKESYEIDKNTILDIDIDNASIVFEESNDNKVHLDYSILFDKDSEEIQYKVFKGIKAKSSKVNNKINLDVKNSMYLGELYSLDVDINTYKEHIRGFYSNKRKNELFYKSKDSILKEIDFSLGTYTDDFFKNLQLDNPNKDYGKSSRKFKQSFIIKVPKNVKINIKALHSKITFLYNIEYPIEINAFKTYLKFKKITSNKNRIILSNGIFQVEKVIDARLEFLDMRKVVIGEVSNVNLASETSKIQIGEIGKNVLFNDFNSKLHFYNFGKKFTTFNLIGDYTDLNLYNVKESNYSMNINGFNTVLNMDDNKTTFGGSNEDKLTKILEKKPKENIVSNGNIAIELKNGIINIK